MQNIRQQQFLMLLFVMAAELDQHPRVRVRCSPEQLQQRLIDMASVASDLIECWPGQQPALGSRMARTNGFVIRIEQKSVLRIEGLVAALL